jgi:hypothetical protein
MKLVSFYKLLPKEFQKNPSTSNWIEIANKNWTSSYWATNCSLLIYLFFCLFSWLWFYFIIWLLLTSFFSCRYFSEPLKTACVLFAKTYANIVSFYMHFHYVYAVVSKKKSILNLVGLLSPPPITFFITVFVLQNMFHVFIVICLLTFLQQTLSFYPQKHNKLFRCLFISNTKFN